MLRKFWSMFSTLFLMLPWSNTAQAQIPTQSSLSIPLPQSQTPALGQTKPQTQTQAQPIAQTQPQPQAQSQKQAKAKPQHRTSAKSEAKPPLDIRTYPNEPEPSKPTANDAQLILTLIENQLNAIESKQYDTAYFSYTAAPFRTATPLDEFKFFITSYPVFTSNKNALFGNLQFKDKVASIKGTLTSMDGKVMKVTYFFVKEGGQWKIIGIELDRTAAQGYQSPSAASYDFQSDVY